VEEDAAALAPSSFLILLPLLVAPLNVLPLIGSDSVIIWALKNLYRTTQLTTRNEQAAQPCGMTPSLLLLASEDLGGATEWLIPRVARVLKIT